MYSPVQWNTRKQWYTSTFDEQTVESALVLLFSCVLLHWWVISLDLCVCVHLLHSYAWTIVNIYIFFGGGGGIFFHLDVHYVCMLVQRFEPQGRRFANFCYYYYLLFCQPHQQLFAHTSWSKILFSETTTLTRLRDQGTYQSNEHCYFTFSDTSIRFFKRCAD